MNTLNDFFTRLARILKKDPRYKEEAYLFVMSSLTQTVDALDKPRHLLGRELLQGIRKSAEEQFGPMAVTVFEHWGIKNSLDFGNIVFNMVQEDVLSKTENDTLEDFRDDVFLKNLFDDVSGYRLPGHAGESLKYFKQKQETE